MNIPRFVLFGCCLAIVSCDSPSTGCPGETVTLPVGFFGDVKGTATMKVVPERFGAIRLEGEISRGSAVIAKISGPGTCSGGTIGATFNGTAPTQKGVRLEDGKLAAVFGPRPLGGRLVGAWDAVIVYKNGVTRPIHGFMRDEIDAVAPEGSGRLGQLAGQAR